MLHLPFKLLLFEMGHFVSNHMAKNVWLNQIKIDQYILLHVHVW